VSGAKGGSCEGQHCRSSDALVCPERTGGGKKEGKVEKKGEREKER